MTTIIIHYKLSRSATQFSSEGLSVSLLNKYGLHFSKKLSKKPKNPSRLVLLGEVSGYKVIT